jgi:type I site-specific restriction-modification system R (restriction) subunit
MEANQAATELLLKGTTVDGVTGWDQGRTQTVHYIDWDHPENNTFRVVNQFRVDEPGGQAKKFIVPDLVLFVNGIPLVVVECKSPGVQEPIEEARDRDTDADTDAPEVEPDAEAIPDAAKDIGEFPILNEDESIVVLVDEAHRSHASALHGNLLKALPNCARIGFTGTPILMGARKRTHEIFGDFIDRYSIKQSEEDGATVPILYEGRTTEGAVAEGRDLDQVFEDMFRGHTPEELDRIKAKYATRGT